jgi:hypothetical protein
MLMSNVPNHTGIRDKSCQMNESQITRQVKRAGSCSNHLSPFQSQSLLLPLDPLDLRIIAIITFQGQWKPTIQTLYSITQEKIPNDNPDPIVPIQPAQALTTTQTLKDWEEQQDDSTQQVIKQFKDLKKRVKALQLLNSKQTTLDSYLVYYPLYCRHLPVFLDPGVSP